MTGFNNPIVGGKGALVYPQIMSPNFNIQNPTASPNPSWAILKTGLAYFFGLILSGGTIIGPDYIINANGFFSYNGTPALGNLIASTGVSVAGTDQFGNIYFQGDCTYQPSGGGTPTLVSQLFNGGIQLGSSNGIGNVSGHDAATVFGNSADGTLTLFSGQQSLIDAPATIELLSQLAGVAGQPIAQIAAALQLTAPNGTPTGPGIFLWPSSNVALLSSKNGIVGAVPISQSDSSVLTNTGTSMNAMSKVWSVPANDAIVNTVYRLTVSGSGTQGSTQQAIAHQLACMGATAANRTMATSTIVASAAFSWKYVAEVTILTTGASGTARVNTEFNWTQGVGGSGLTSANEATGVTDVVATIDTTTNKNIALQMGWAAVVGGPTISSFRSLFERLGA